jgi:TP901 family phage tail tape measure protein
MGANGEMRALSEIAKDAQVAFGDVSGTEQLTAMLEDMNVRGATAFALLVQNADEFGEAVNNLQNSAGEATAMAEVQQESLANQIQLVKNAIMAPFLFSDEVGEANNTLNEFKRYIFRK